ncbi:MAG: hypothetical protein WDO16_16605 [Bacteroidota bacterium]
MYLLLVCFGLPVKARKEDTAGSPRNDEGSVGGSDAIGLCDMKILLAVLAMTKDLRNGVAALLLCSFSTTMR